MSVFGSVFIAMLAALGVALVMLEVLRKLRARKASFIYLCFSEDMFEERKPDMVVICRTDAEQEEILRRICADESRKVYIKRM